MLAPHYEPACLAATSGPSPGRSLRRSLKLLLKRFFRLASRI
jgi:hypothetical protein